MTSLFRGFDSRLISAVQTNILHHTPRTPTHTKNEIHVHADSWFFKRFGVKARSSTLICTTNFEQARSYGYSYKITPIEPALLIYSPLINDFLEHELDLQSYSQSDVWMWMECKHFKMVRSVGDIEPDFLGEVMVHCDQYTAIPH